MFNSFQPHELQRYLILLSRIFDLDGRVQYMIFMLKHVQARTTLSFRYRENVHKHARST